MTNPKGSKSKSGLFEGSLDKDREAVDQKTLEGMAQDSCIYEVS